MLSSHHFQLNEIVDAITLAGPEKLLDIGIGFGKFGFLAREYLELWKEGADYHKRAVQIDGIEAYEPYITPVHKLIYDNIFIGNALEILPGLEEKYDLILMIDVFEHFTYEDGCRLLEYCRKASRNILISVPVALSPQEAVFGNRFEEHKYAWQKKDFRKIQDKFYITNVRSLICFMGDDSLRIKKILKKRRLMTGIVSVLEFLHIKNVVRSLLKWR